jgi:hypothetical protein
MRERRKPMQHDDDIMQPKHLQIFPTPNIPWRVDIDWKLKVDDRLDVWPVWCARHTGNIRWTTWSSVHPVPGRYWSDWPVLNVLTSSLMGTTRSVAGKSNPREAMSVASRKLASIEIYWDLPSLSFFRWRKRLPTYAILPSLWSFVII